MAQYGELGDMMSVPDPRKHLGVDSFKILSVRQLANRYSLHNVSTKIERLPIEDSDELVRMLEDGMFFGFEKAEVPDSKYGSALWASFMNEKGIIAIRYIPEDQAMSYHDD